MIIAIDGPAAAGKGTLARRLAETFNLAYLDTGALYRAVALRLLRTGADPGDPAAADTASREIDRSLLADPELRAEETGRIASRISRYPAVRSNLLDFQRNFARSERQNRVGAVLDGRDIGTVVCPDADLKLFVTATPQVRAERRWRELQERGDAVSFDRILVDVKARDESDMNRPDAPLKPAEDAHLLDTTDLDIEAAFDRAAALVRETRTRGR